MTKKTCMTTTRNAPELVPILNELEARLTKHGFMQLTEKAAAKLPDGSVVVFFNHTKKIFSIYIIENASSEGRQISFRHKRRKPEDICVTDPAVEEACHGYVDFRLPSSSFKNYLYKVISSQSIEDDDEVLENAGFQKLSEAQPSEMPRGSVVLLREHDTYRITPVIVRELSHQFEGDHRLLYWVQSQAVVGEWHSKVLMDHVPTFSKHDYLVLC